MKLLPAIVAALLATAPVVPAIESAADQARARAEIRPELSLGDFERFSAEGVPDDQWPAVIEALGQEDRARVARALIRGLQPFPAKQLLPLLQHSRLAVRLGALDLLEEAAGDDFGFDPWSEAPATGANAGALVKWQAWVESGTPAAQPAATLTDEAFRAAATEVMSGERARVERGMQRLEAFGLNAGVSRAFFKPSLDWNLRPARNSRLPSIASSCSPRCRARQRGWPATSPRARWSSNRPRSPRLARAARPCCPSWAIFSRCRIPFSARPPWIRPSRPRALTRCR